MADNCRLGRFGTADPGCFGWKTSVDVTGGQLKAGGSGRERRIKMGRTVNQPCKHIVSFRVNKSDHDLLKKWSRSSGMSVSNMIRKMVVRMKELDLLDEIANKDGLESNSNQPQRANRDGFHVNG